MITQFQGEDRSTAIVNHFSLDIEQEEDFIAFIETMGYTVESDDETIEGLYKMWREQRGD